MKILVIGETCRDVFTYGICTRLSPESPVPVFNPIETITNDGMAKNVHSNILSLDIDCHLVTNPSWQDITKTRFIEKRSNHMFLRVDKNDSNYGRIDLKNINFKEYNIVVISDYDKGFITEEDIKTISRLHAVTFLDTKKKLGSWCENIKFIKINNFEYDKTKDSLTSQLKDKMIITLGGGGAKYQGKTFPVDKVEVKDVAGAGDTFIAGLVVKYSETQSMPDSIDFANHCATLAVQKRGVSIVGEKNEVH